MSNFTIVFTEIAGEIIRASRYNRNWSAFLADYNGNISNVNIAANAAIVESKLSLNYPTHPQNTIIPIDVNMVTSGAIPPTSETIDGLPTLGFAAGAGESVYLRFIVPYDYASGQITLKLNCRCDNNNGTILFTAQSSLIPSASATALTDPYANKYSSTNVAVDPNGGITGPNNPFQLTGIDLTSSTGAINSVAVAYGDIISVLLTRGSGTNTGKVNIMGIQVSY